MDDVSVRDLPRKNCIKGIPSTSKWAGFLLCNLVFCLIRTALGFRLSFFSLLLNLFRLGEHQLCARFGAELDLARVAVEARGLVSLELDALVADDNVNLAHAAVDERHALAAVDGLVLARRKVLAAHLALALALAEHKVEVAAAAPGMGVVPAVEAVDLVGVQRQLLAAVVVELDRALKRRNEALIVGQRRKVGLCVLDRRGAQPPQKVAIGVHRARGRDAELGRQAAGPLGRNVVTRR